MTPPDDLTRRLMTRTLTALWLPEPLPLPSEADLLRRVGEDAAELLRHVRERREQAFEMLRGEEYGR